VLEFNYFFFFLPFWILIWEYWIWVFSFWCGWFVLWRWLWTRIVKARRKGGGLWCLLWWSVVFVGFHGHSAGLRIEKASIPNQRQIQFCGLDLIFFFFLIWVLIWKIILINVSARWKWFFFFFFLEIKNKVNYTNTLSVWWK
jgi:hypothetical protein